MNKNLVGCIYGRFSLKIAHFVLICRHGQFLFLIARFLKICETSTIKIAHFVLIH